MVWPKRKILLVLAGDTAEVTGVQALFRGLNLDYVLKTPEMMPNTKETTLESDWLDCGPLEMCTELVFGDGLLEEEPWRLKASRHGLRQRSLTDFLHNLWEESIIIPMEPSCMAFNGRPLLWILLSDAGFEPSFLWAEVDGTWKAEVGRGLHWVLAASWLAKLVGDEALGRKVPGQGHISWIVRENKADFYWEKGRQEFVGSLPYRCEPTLEQAFCETVAQALNFGVSFYDIKQSLSKLSEEEGFSNCLRWNADDNGRDAGQNREELSSEKLDDLENWWAS